MYPCRIRWQNMMGNGILIIGPCSSRRGMPYPQADTIMIHETATFFYACSFPATSKQTNKQTNKQKIGPEPRKTWCLALVTNDRLSLGLSPVLRSSEISFRPVSTRKCVISGLKTKVSWSKHKP